MCGFVIIVGLEGQTVPEAALIKSSKAIEHRGPDDEKIIVRDNCGIAFRRLSINDIEGGAQPIWDTSLALVCNGEIYNSPDLRRSLPDYHFRTSSDCEALLPLYRQDSQQFVARLEGMFAFSILDFENKRITFGRDRFGIKPLYYYQDKSWLIVGSEVKALIASGLIPKALDADYVYDSFTFGYSIDQKTIVKGIKSLPPAHIALLNFSNPALEMKEYWNPTFPERKGIRDLFDGPRNQQIIKQSLDSAVQTHLLSDVPVAAYLSGGLDSTITSILMKRHLTSQLTTFSIGFSDAEFDESPVFRKTVEFGNFKGLEVQATVDDIQGFAEAVKAIEIVQFSPMDIPLVKLSQKVRAEGIKVVLCGEGADEIFGGYSVFPWLHIAQALNLPSARSIRDIIAPKALNFLGIHPIMHPVFCDVFSDSSLEIQNSLGFCPPWLPIWRRREKRISSLFAERPKSSLKDHPALQAISTNIRKKYSGIDQFDAAVFCELKTRLPNYILHRTDRTSMKNSVEARVPFLDRVFAENAIACAPLLKTFGFREKSILRKSFSSILPPYFKSLRKFGYSAPNQWCWTAQGKDLVDRYLSSDALRSSGLFDVNEIESRIKGVQQAAQTNNWQLKELEDAGFMTGVISFQILKEEFGL